MHSKVISCIVLVALSSFANALPTPKPWDGGNAYTGAAGNSAGGAANPSSTGGGPLGVGALDLVDPYNNYNGLLGLSDPGLGTTSLMGENGGDGGRAVSGDAVAGSGGDK